MKKVLVSGRKKYIRRFHCPMCGCVFESDEYVSKILNDVVQVEEDECPNCKAGCSVYTVDPEDEE